MDLSAWLTIVGSATVVGVWVIDVLLSDSASTVLDADWPVPIPDTPQSPITPAGGSGGARVPVPPPPPAVAGTLRGNVFIIRGLRRTGNRRP